MKCHSRYLGVLYVIAVFIAFNPRPEMIHAASCNEFPASSFENDPSLTKHEGKYVNDAWGYSIEIPKGLIGKSAPPDHPQHGFGILLSRKPLGYIWVDGSANSLEWKSLYQAANAHISWIREGALKILTVEKHQTKLSGFQAVRLVVRYECPKANLTEDYFIAIDSRQIVYTIALTAESKRYPSYKKILENIANTWQLRSRARE